MNQGGHPHQMGASNGANGVHQVHGTPDNSNNPTGGDQPPQGGNVTSQGQTPKMGISPAPQLCRLGQEYAQEIVTKTMELFQHLRTSQPPNGTAMSIQMQEEKKKKIAIVLTEIFTLFSRLRKIYDKVNESTNLMEFVQIESLIPLKEEERDHHHHHHRAPLEDKKKTSDIVRTFSLERNNAIEQLRLKNRQLKDIIDMLRDIVWDINTMLSMRKP
jgi:mediator of RNA polymerase II transcription subunit 30